MLEFLDHFSIAPEVLFILNMHLSYYQVDSYFQTVLQDFTRFKFVYVYEIKFTILVYLYCDFILDVILNSPLRFTYLREFLSYSVLNHTQNVRLGGRSDHTVGLGNKSSVLDTLSSKNISSV